MCNSTRTEAASFFSFFLYFTSRVAVLAVCLLFTLKCSYAADSLLCRDNHSGEEADHQIVRRRSSIGDRRNGRQERKKREDKHLVQTRLISLVLSTRPQSPMLNTVSPCRRCFAGLCLRRPSVRPIAAICTYMLSIMLLPEENIPIASTSWWFNKKVND